MIRETSDQRNDLMEQHNRVVFDNTSDQYVKGEDVIAFFTIPDGIKAISNEDQIGLLRASCTNIKNCITYAPVKFNESTRSEFMRHGTAIFSSSSLSVTDDEFYQFCYINKNSQNLGTSIPFQLNCALDDIDLLFNTSGERSQTKSLVAYKTPSEQEENRLRAQLAITTQFAMDQASQIVDLERRLIQANDLARKSNERQILLEQQLRDFTLTSEKHLRSLQGQLNQSLKISNQRQTSLEQQLRDLVLTSEKYQRSIQGQLNIYSKQNSIEFDEKNTLKYSLMEIEKRCVKHQQNENDLKRQLNIYQNIHNDLQHEIKYLTQRLSISTEEYQILSRKYNALERKIDDHNTYQNQQEIESISTPSSFTDVKTGQRSSFYWQLPQYPKTD